MKLVAVRHARTGYNAEGRLQGSLDVPLGAEGLAQAEDIAHALVAQYGPALTVITSPLARASQTADAVARLVGGVAVADARLTQRAYGAWEGLTWDDVQAEWPTEYERRRAGFDPAIPGWGASEDVADRVAAALREHAAAVPDDAVLVAVSHGSAIMLGVSRLLGLPLEPPRLGHLPHGAFNHLSWHQGADWRLVRYCVGASGRAGGGFAATR